MKNKNQVHELNEEQLAQVAGGWNGNISSSSNSATAPQANFVMDSLVVHSPVGGINIQQSNWTNQANAVHIFKKVSW